MIAATYADLLDAATLSAFRLDTALQAGAPKAWAACARFDARCSRPVLRNALLSALPDALDVGLVEHIRGRWLPNRPPADGKLLMIDLRTESELDLMENGSAALTLRLVATACLVQTHASWWQDREGNVQVGNGGAWQTTLCLSVGDASAAGAAGAQFHTQRALVHLPPGPWAAR